MRPSRYLSWLRRQVLPDLAFCAAVLALFVGFMLSLPYEHDDQLVVFPTEYRIGMVALEEAHYIKVDIKRDDMSVEDFRNYEGQDYYTVCEGTAPEADAAQPDAAQPDSAGEPKGECKHYRIAVQDIACANRAAAHMRHVPQNIDPSALLLTFMAVESLARGPVAREVEFLSFDAAGLVGWHPDLSLGRGQIRVSTAARILSGAGNIAVDYATARIYLADDCKTLFIMARYLDELFSQRAGETPVDEALSYVIARYNGQVGSSISGRTYTSVVTCGYHVMTSGGCARLPGDDRYDENVVHQAIIDFDLSETALDLDHVVDLQRVVESYKGESGSIILVRARGDGVSPPDYQQSLAQMRANEIRRWLLRLGAFESDIRVAPVALDRLSESKDSVAAVILPNRQSQQ